MSVFKPGDEVTAKGNSQSPNDKPRWMTVNSVTNDLVQCFWFDQDNSFGSYDFHKNVLVPKPVDQVKSKDIESKNPVQKDFPVPKADEPSLITKFSDLIQMVDSGHLVVNRWEKYSSTSLVFALVLPGKKYRVFNVTDIVSYADRENDFSIVNSELGHGGGWLKIAGKNVTKASLDVNQGGLILYVSNNGMDRDKIVSDLLSLNLSIWLYQEKRESPVTLTDVYRCGFMKTPSGDFDKSTLQIEFTFPPSVANGLARTPQRITTLKDLVGFKDWGHYHTNIWETASGVFSLLFGDYKYHIFLGENLVSEESVNENEYGPHGKGWVEISKNQKPMAFYDREGGTLALFLHHPNIDENSILNDLTTSKFSIWDTESKKEIPLRFSHNQTNQIDGNTSFMSVSFGFEPLECEDGVLFKDDNVELTRDKETGDYIMRYRNPDE